jgi:hypothetical protein
VDVHLICVEAMLALKHCTEDQGVIAGIPGS